MDGHEVAVHNADGLFQTDRLEQAVRVPTGSHVVRFSYAPPNIGWGLLGLLLGCAWLLSAPVTRLRRGRGPS